MWAKYYIVEERCYKTVPTFCCKLRNTMFSHCIPLILIVFYVVVDDTLQSEIINGVSAMVLFLPPDIE